MSKTNLFFMLIALASVAAASAAKTEDGIKKAAKTEGR